MKRVLTIQDISCVGRCSLTVSLPVLSAMGLQTSILPTAVLSTHTGFPNPTIVDLTEEIDPIVQHWKQQNITFDGICTGYLRSAQQIEVMLQLFSAFKGEGNRIFVDPAMADNGKLYSGFDNAFVEKMKTLCTRADVLLPNVTEACLLTDTPYAEDYTKTQIQTLLKKLSDLGAGTVLITGVSISETQTGVMGYQRQSNTFFEYFHEKLPHSYPGTGDIFTAVCSGAMVLGKPCQAAAELAADYTARCVRRTMECGSDRRFGVAFEPEIPALLSLLNGCPVT